MTKFDADPIWPSPLMLPSASRLLDMLPGLVAYFGPDLRYRYANATYAAWRGLAPAQIVGSSCREIVGETNYPTVRGLIEQALEGNSVTAEYTLFDGANARDVQGSYVPDLDATGQVCGVVLLVTDISVRRDLEARIVETEGMFDDAFHHAPVGMVVTNPDGRMERVNRAFATMLGMSSAQLVGTDFRAITHPDDVDADDRQFRQLLAGRRSSYRMDKRYLRAGGEIVHTTLAVSAVRGLDGTPVRVIAQIEDVSERRKAEREQQEVTARLMLAMEAVRGGFWHIDVETMRFEMSPSFQRFVSGSDTAGSLDLEDYAERIVPATRDAASVQALVDGTIDETSVEYELETIAGPRWMRCDRRLLRAPDGSPLRIVGVTIDISEDHERQLAAETAAGTDPLTGLLNRRGLDQRLGQPSTGWPLGVVAIDLDRFKAVNDSMGHSVGDAVLVEVAQRLRAAVRPTDYVARLGGDEFAVLLPESSAERVAAAAERIEVTLNAPMVQGDAVVPISASVGVVMTEPDDGKTALESFTAVWRRADVALYAAKRARQERWADPA
ncbi:GGDEF and EAL domain-containing protein [Sphingomonas glacialis]|uniref:Diguanylate cyclase n=1 Tax=Sphingomonas glacialis TaxID=658225 RepID=A0A502FXN7_9SPHN|nr:GGDEF and EAL domain-containing protein [Sphingomonas glacialis]TPG54201.1 diguanylate cyclase [Sphingomonas glacialis]